MDCSRPKLYEKTHRKKEMKQKKKWDQTWFDGSIHDILVFFTSNVKMGCDTSFVSSDIYLDLHFRCLASTHF